MTLPLDPPLVGGDSLAEDATPTHRDVTELEYQRDRALLELSWYLCHRMGHRPEYRDIRLVARAGDWHHDIDRDFADLIVASDGLPTITRWERIPGGRVRFAGSEPLSIGGQQSLPVLGC